MTTQRCLAILLFATTTVIGMAISREPRTASTHASLSRMPASTKQNLLSTAKLFRAYATDEADLSLPELREILKTHQFARIEDLLAYLRKAKPEYMKYYTLMHHSPSLQDKASFEHPRAIVFGKTANFVMTFNGHPSQGGYDALEVMQFDAKSRRFELHEIQFNEFGKMNKPYDLSDSNESDAKCLVCHTGSRPIWNAYTLWPGAFGGVDDIGVGKSVARFADGIEGFLGRGFAAKATEQWRDFQESAAKKGRYGYLPPLASSRYLALAEELHGQKYTDEAFPRPNTDLNVALMVHNFNRIGEILHEKLRNDDLRYVLLYTVSDCRYLFQDDFNTHKERIDAVATKFYEEAKPAFDTHLVTSLRQLAKDYDIGWQELRARALNGSYADGLKEKYTKVNSEKEFYDVFSSTDFGGFLFQQLHRMDWEELQILAPVKYLVPSANVEQWPMAMYEGVYNFNSGDRGGEHVLRYVLLDRIFVPYENDLVERLQEAETMKKAPHYKQEPITKVCADIAAKFPKRFLKFSDPLVAAERERRRRER